ncbi:hypothetical protein SLA2020_116590 [Shorea laevis]
MSLQGKGISSFSPKWILTSALTQLLAFLTLGIKLWLILKHLHSYTKMARFLSSYWFNPEFGWLIHYQELS